MPLYAPYLFGPPALPPARTTTPQDAGGVLAAALPTPRHLVLLRDDGRVGLYGVLPP